MKITLRLHQFLILLTLLAGAEIITASEPKFDNHVDKNWAAVFEKRDADWRNGAIVYQVLVDRFARPDDMSQKMHLYEAPKTLREWHEEPKGGHYVESVGVWSHEIDFWGGDIDSLRKKLDYIDELGVDVLYLNPIHLGYTNHKYDSLDYNEVSPEFGTREDVRALIKDVHARDMKIVLDGVFNHMGRNSEAFQSAVNDPNSAYRDWFYFGDQYPGGHRAWATALNLPELNLENKEVRDHVYRKKDSVVQSYLADGIDGWRLDVAFDIGFKYLEELTQAAHKKSPGSVVIGEIWNYPAEWFPSIDGIMNFAAREVIWRTTKGEISPTMGAKMLDRMIADAGIENMLKSWNVIDNHDTPRIKNMLPEVWQQRMAQVIQFSMPGSPNLYYGTELGMTGGEDPEMRGAMRWDWVNEENETLAWTKKLIDIHNENRSLRIGNFRLVTSEKLLAYERYTDRAGETIVVIANPTNETVNETVMIANSKLMNWATMTDLLGNYKDTARIRGSLLKLAVEPGQTLMFRADVAPNAGYTPYKRTK